MEKCERHSPLRSNIIAKYNESENKRVGLTKEENGNGWTILNSSLFDISKDFLPTLPEKFSMGIERNWAADREIGLYLQEKFWRKKQGIVMVEMGGPAVRLANNLHKFINVDKSFGVTLDIGYKKAEKVKDLDVRDIANNHEIIIGDMFLPETFEVLRSKLNGKKVDVLFERMEGGLHILAEADCNPVWTYKQLNNWYNLLSDNGVMFVQMPYHLWDFPEAKIWLNNMEKNHKKYGINFNFYSKDVLHYFFRLEKTTAATANLPIPISIHRSIKNSI